jgi:hypothetical protein
MTVQAWLVFTSDDNTDVLALNEPESGVAVIPRLVDNPLANQLGEGDIATERYVCPARLLNDPDYTPYWTLCSGLPIRTWDSDVLFLPDPEV